MPPQVGFLAVGALVGPHSLRLVRHPEMVDQLAEIGVVVLLFTVGMELSLRRLAKMRRVVLIGGGIQLLATISLGMIVAKLVGLAWGPAIFAGFLLALSSTAAVTKILGDRGEFSAPHGPRRRPQHPDVRHHRSVGQRCLRRRDLPCRPRRLSLLIRGAHQRVAHHLQDRPGRLPARLVGAEAQAHPVQLLALDRAVLRVEQDPRRAA